MNLNLEQSSGLQRVSNIIVPDIFFQRIKTGVEVFDELFGGEGIIPCLTFTLAAEAGSGKSTLLLQLLNILDKQGKKCAYVSGEESVFQVSFSSKRLGVDVPIANIQNIDDICKLVETEHLDFLIIDSIPSLTTTEKMNSRKKEEYISNKIVETAKKFNCVIGCILHMTKAGMYKGSTILPHSVDLTCLMRKDEFNLSYRNLEVTKNRFGRPVELTLEMTEAGFDLSRAIDDVAIAAEPTKKSAVTSKKPKESRMDIYKREMLETMSKNNNQITPNMFSVWFCVGIQTINNVLRSLICEGKVIKTGRGENTVWKIVS